MKPILEHLAVAVFLVMIIGYIIAAEIKQRRLEQYIENQRNKKKEEYWKKKCCRRCANLMIHVHAPDGQTVEFCGFVCEKTWKPVKLDDIKACYEKPIGIEQ